MTKGREAIYIEPNNMAQIERMRRYYQMIAKQTGRSVRPFRGDGYVNLVTQLGNNRNNQAPVYRPELLPSDTELAALYEGSGLFSKIIDAPAEEAIKHGFELQDVTDAKINDFISEALDELEWENTAATAIKWSRLFGGSIIVMLIDDGRGIDEPLDWKNIKSIDELRVFERAIVVPDETSMYRYVPGNPLGGNRYGEPEFYTVSSRYGFFNVHESRCLVFRNGRVPEFSANSIYQLWGIPEYVRMKQALANSELAYGSAPKMLERCVQAVYKMKNLAEELSTEDGEQNVLKRLEVIDLARGLLNSIAIDNEGEDYDFKTFSFTGVADVIDSTCNMLSAVSNIPQTILFGRSPAGMNATGTSDLENWYNYIERVQKTQVKKNLRYLLSVIFQAGMYHGEIDEIPKIKISFNPLWSLSEQDKANVDKVKADTELVRANTANLYIQAEVISSDEVRSALAKTDEFDIETMLDDMEDDENLMTSIHDPVSDPDGGEGEENSGADVTDNTDPTAPDATKNPAESAKASLPTEPKRSDGNDYDDFPEYGMWLEEHMEATREEQKAAEEHYKALKKAGNRQHSNRDNQSTKEQKTGGVGVIVVKDGKILCGKRHNDTGYGLLCGPGGHVEHGETAEQAAIRETQEEFGITPKNIIQLGYGPKEPETGIAPAIFLCTEYDGEPECDDLEMVAPQFLSLDELEAKSAEQYQPFKDGIVVLLNCLNMNHDGDSAFFGGELNSIKPGSYDVMRPDGGEGSGNFGHSGVPGQIGGSAPNGFDSSNIAAYERGAKLSKSQKDRALGIAGASALGANSSSAVRFIEDHGEIRTVVKTDKGEVDIRIKPESKSAYLEMVYANKKNGGNGAEIISDIVANSRSQGLEKIDAYGAGENGSSYNGYYSLPRLGFDAPIPDDLKSGLKEAGISAANISDLMGSDAGRAWWKNNGHGTDMTFDLSDGSTSLNMLSSYLNRDSIDEATDNTLNGDGGPGSGNFGHEGVPGQVGGSAPAGAASSAASAEKVSTLKENFGNLKQNQKYAYLGRTGIVPKGELDSLKAGVASSDQKAIAKLAEYEETYFNLAEYGSEAKSLKVEMRDDVAAMSDEDAAAWAKQSMDRRLESHEGWANQYSAAQKVAIDMGVYETPQVVSQEDFDKYVKESGAAVCYRGVKDIDSMTGENMMFQMAYNTQEPYYGDGIFGDGLYFSTRKETAEGYAGRAAIATCAVRPDSKILEYGSPEHEKAKKRVQTTDDSVAALCSGYDVIHKKMGGNEDYYVILNRAALVMVDPVSKQGDLAIRAAQKNAGRSNGDSTRISPENNMGNLDNCGKNATIKVQKTHTDGGPSSGNFGHAGRTGKVGGSASGESTIEVEGSSGKKAKKSIPAIDTGDAAAEVKNGRHNSLEKYIDSDGNLSPERQALHAEIVSEYFEGKEKVDGVRTATFLGGGPASGKSSLRDSGLIVQADDPSTVTIDPDGLKGKLPGYEEMASETDSAAAFYHEESSAVAKTLYSTALDYGCNTVYDGTGDGSVNSMRKKIKDAHDAGYKAVGEYVTVDIDEALRRNELRYEAAKEKYEKGLSKVPPRLPDAQIVKSIHRKVTDISVECASEFDSIKIYDNNGARGSAPTLIATGGNGKPLSAVNKTLLQKYLDKGEKKWKIDEKGEVVPG